tara:strand:- start:818 stop:1108 length:291 start_codon:yes stop_codon:yes gene_type:complete
MTMFKHIFYYSDEFEKWILVNKYLKHKGDEIFLKVELSKDSIGETNLSFNGYNRTYFTPFWSGAIRNTPSLLQSYIPATKEEYEEAERWYLLEQIK